MPIKKCKSDGKDGFKYGNSGKCYTDKDAKKKAAKQGVAIEINRYSEDSSNESVLDLAAKMVEKSKKQMPLHMNISSDGTIKLFTVIKGAKKIVETKIGKYALDDAISYASGWFNCSKEEALKRLKIK